MMFGISGLLSFLHRFIADLFEGAAHFDETRDAANTAMKNMEKVGKGAALAAGAAIAAGALATKGFKGAEQAKLPGGNGEKDENEQPLSSMTHKDGGSNFFSPPSQDKSLSNKPPVPELEKPESSSQLAQQELEKPENNSQQRQQKLEKPENNSQQNQQELEKPENNSQQSQQEPEKPENNSQLSQQELEKRAKSLAEELSKPPQGLTPPENDIYGGDTSSPYAETGTEQPPQSQQTQQVPHASQERNTLSDELPQQHQGSWLGSGQGQEPQLQPNQELGLQQQLQPHTSNDGSKQRQRYDTTHFGLDRAKRRSDRVAPIAKTAATVAAAPVAFVAGALFGEGASKLVLNTAGALGAYGGRVATAAAVFSGTEMSRLYYGYRQARTQRLSAQNATVTQGNQLPQRLSTQNVTVTQGNQTPQRLSAQNATATQSNQSPQRIRNFVRDVYHGTQIAHDSEGLGKGKTILRAAGHAAALGTIITTGSTTASKVTSAILHGQKPKESIRSISTLPPSPQANGPIWRPASGMAHPVVENEWERQARQMSEKQAQQAQKQAQKEAKKAKKKAKTDTPQDS